MSCPHTLVASLSPGGKCIVCAPAARNDTRDRLDAWQNALTGIGNVLQDKRMSTDFALEVVTPEYAEILYRGDDLACRMVETWPNEMLRQGYDITVSESEADPETYVEAASRGDGSGWIQRKKIRRDEAAKGQKLQDQVSKKLEELGANEAFHTALCYRRAYGGGAILIGANDGVGDLAKPLVPERVVSIDFLTVLEPRELTPLYYYADPRAPKFGQVAIYNLQTVAPGAPAPSTGGKAFGITFQQIHESRLIIFMGSRVTRRVTTEATPGWGDSIFTRTNRVLSDFNVSWASAGILVHDFAQAVFKIKGLADAMAMDKDDILKIRMRAVELSRSTARAVLIDAEEDFKREQTPVAGLPELLDRFMSRLAAAADMPLTLLMGQSPGGLNATGDSDVRFFYDRVSSAQQRDLEPALKRLICLIMTTLGGEPEQWGIEFRPLWQPTEKEQADARFVQAQTDEKYVMMDVLSAAEVAKNRFGGDRYSFQTQIDFEARERLEVAAPPPVAKDGEDPDDEPDPLEVPPGGGGGFGGKPPGGKPPAKRPAFGGA